MKILNLSPRFTPIAIGTWLNNQTDPPHIAIKKLLVKKLIIFLFLSGLFIKSFAQQPKVGIDPENKFRSHKLVIPKNSLDKLKAGDIYSSPLFGRRQFSHTPGNGDNVYLLPQDHMPCIVPDMSQYNYNMPVDKGKITGTIPNPSPPFRIIPKEKSE